MNENEAKQIYSALKKFHKDDWERLFKEYQVA